MRSFEIKPSAENIAETFINDSLQRDIDVKRFISLLNTIEDNCSIALNGQWGSGKTFFIKQVKMLLDVLNKNNTIFNDSSFRQNIEETWNKLSPNNKLDVLPQVTIYYDAWENDNDEDPILSLVYTMLQSVDTDYNFMKSPNIIKIAASILEFFSGKKINVILDAFKKNDPLAEIRAQKNIYTLVNNFLDSLLEDNGSRLVIIIDELDRCKPSYAVNLLERIKHYFTNEKVTFVFSVNVNELQHTIKQFYGNDFDAGRYLNRFFDLQLPIPPAKLENYYESLGLNSGYLFESFCKSVINTFKLNLRETAKFYRIAKIAAFKLTHNDSFYNGSSDRKAYAFVITYILPISLGLKIYNPSRYYSFINGKDITPIIDVLNNKPTSFILSNIFNASENYKVYDEKQLADVIVNKIEIVYNALFNQIYDNIMSSIYVGIMEFSKDTREFYFRIESLLSEYMSIE